MRTSSRSTSTRAPSTKVPKAHSAKAAKRSKTKPAAPSLVSKLRGTEPAPAKQYRGPVLHKPTAELEVRRDITPAIVAKIAEEAKFLVIGDVALGMPFATFVSEAVDCALMIHKYWTTPNPDKYRSLSAYAHRLGHTMAAEIVHLVDRAEVARDEAKAIAKAVDELQISRARFVNRELRLAAELDADDGVRDEKDVSVEALRRSHETTPRTIAALADSIGAYARYAKKHTASFAQAPDFDVALIAEGELLSDALRARRKATRATNEARETRDLYLQLLIDRIAKVRRLVRHAYRATPEVIREATSAFHRERRRADRNRGTAEGDGATPTPGTDGDA